VKRRVFILICALVVFASSCPKRQDGNRIVYVPQAPSSLEPSLRTEAGALVIEEPQPPELEEVAPAEQTPAFKPPAKRTPRAARPDPTAALEAPVEPEPNPPIEIPALETRENPSAQAALRQQIVGLQNQVRARITHVAQANLSSGERNTLEDARTFLGQSERALAESDLQRARNLARKASMLVAVLEQQ